MRTCDLCDEPATHDCLLVNAVGESRQFYCYVHAAEADILETPINILEPIAKRIGYPVNGMLFVIEALAREKLIEDSGPSGSTATILPSLSIESACYAVYHSAVERFRTEARTTLEHWNISSVGDIGNILIPLIEAGVLILSESPLLEGLQKRFLMSGADSLFQADA